MRKLDFLIIGAAKSGTTTVFNSLTEHSKIFKPRTKEIHFFNKEKKFEKGLDFYHSFFVKAIDSELIGEATPEYLSSKKYAERIFNYNKRIKLILILRDPVERAYSNFLHDIQYGNIQNDLSFEETIKQSNRYIDYVIYYTQINNYLEYFTKDQLFIGLFDDLKKIKEYFWKKFVIF